MKLSIAQVTAENLDKQLKQAVDTALSDGADLLVFPSHVFQTPEFFPGYETAFKEACRRIARVAARAEDTNLVMLFPFLDDQGRYVMIRTWDNQMDFLSYENIDDLPYVDDFDFDDLDFLMTVNSHIINVLPYEDILCIKDTTIGYIHNTDAEILKERYNTSAPYDILLYFGPVPHRYKAGFEPVVYNFDHSFEDFIDSRYANLYVCNIAACGLYSETVFPGGSKVCDVQGNEIGVCPRFKPGLLTVDLREGWEEVLVDPKASSKPGETEDVTLEELLESPHKDTLEAIKFAMRKYACHTKAQAIVLPVIDTFSSLFLFDLAKEVFPDRELIAVCHDSYPSVSLYYDLDAADSIVHVAGVEGDGNTNIENLYLECMKVAKQKDGLALIPECMSEYLQFHLLPLPPRYCFCPFSHLLYTDIFNVKDVYEMEKGEGPAAIFADYYLSRTDRMALKKLVIESVNAYLSYDHTQAEDIPSAMGRIWDRSDFAAQDVIRGVDCDFGKMRYMMRYFYEIMDRLLYESYMNMRFGDPLSDSFWRIYAVLSDPAREQILEYRNYGARFLKDVGQGIMFRVPLRPSQALPLLHDHLDEPHYLSEKPKVETSIEGIKFNFEKMDMRKLMVEELDTGRLMKGLKTGENLPDSLANLDPSIKEQLYKAIAEALGEDDEDNPAKYMLDMYRLASLTDEADNGFNLFSQN